MNIQEILSKIQRDEITAIDEEVRVQFDNAQQTPLGFQWRGRHYEVLKLLQVIKSPEGYLQYLLLTGAGIFSVALLRKRDHSSLSRSRWVLNYRVKEDGRLKNSSGTVSPTDEALSLPRGMSRPAMVPLPLSNVAYYHGHLCPELAIGYRAALIACRHLGLCRENAHEFFVLAENMSSAIEALQLVTGCTIGNQNFYAYDMGKQVYYFGRFSTAHESRKALRLALTNLVVDLSHKGETEKNILAGRAGTAELKEYQQAVDDSVREIMSLPDGDLFSQTWVSLRPPQAPARKDYIRCSCCGEVLALEKSVPGKDGLLCRVCAAKGM